MMKTPSKPFKSVAQPLATLLFLLAPFSGQCFYNPSAGRWLNRDPIAEQGGPNPQLFANNTPASYADALGLCAKECGVQSVALKPDSGLLPLRPGGWKASMIGGVGLTLMYDIRYHMRADIVFLKDQQHDPSSCRYVQLVQLTTSANGVPGTKTETGVPADGQLHLDVAWPVPPGWTDDNIEKHLNLLPSTSSTSLSLPDSPGIRNQPTGTTITYDAIFEAIVKDITRRDSEGDLLTVAFDWLHINATGTVPRPSVFPGTLSQGY